MCVNTLAFLSYLSVREYTCGFCFFALLFVRFSVRLIWCCFPTFLCQCTVVFSLFFVFRSYFDERLINLHYYYLVQHQKHYFLKSSSSSIYVGGFMNSVLSIFCPLSLMNYSPVMLRVISRDMADGPKFERLQQCRAPA